jgi:hypothetical protein
MNAPPRGGRQPCRKHRPFPMPGRNRSGFHPRAWSECSLPSSAKPARRPFPASPCWWRGTDRSAGLMRSAGRAGSNHGRCSGADPVLAGSVVHLGSNVAPDPPKSAFRAAHWPPAARVTFGMIFRARAAVKLGERLARQRRPVLLDHHAGIGERGEHCRHAAHNRQVFAGNQIALRAGVAQRVFDVERGRFRLCRSHLCGTTSPVRSASGTA